MKNKGIDLADGDSTDVSTIDNQENTLLRFFAGCEMLTAKPQKYRKKKVKPKKPSVKIAPEPIKKTTEKKSIHCVLYYPNNYSGIDDAPLKTSTVNAIHYLMNGIGAQKMINETTKEAEDLPTTISLTPYIMKENSKIEGEVLDHYGGYEKRDNESTISITVKPLNPDYETIRKTYADLVSKEKKGKLKMEDNKLINEISKLRESVDETNVLLKEIKDYLNKSSIDEIIYYVRKKSIR